MEDEGAGQETLPITGFRQRLIEGSNIGYATAIDLWEATLDIALRSNETLGTSESSENHETDFAHEQSTEGDTNAIDVTDLDKDGSAESLVASKRRSTVWNDFTFEMVNTDTESKMGTDDIFCPASTINELGSLTINEQGHPTNASLDRLYED